MDQVDVLVGLSELILHPEHTCEQMRQRFGVEYLPLVENPGEAGVAYEEDWLAIGDDAVLRIWYIPSQLDRGTVVYSMGTSGNMACYLFSADLLRSSGWSVVMYDYEGYGGSGGTPYLGSLARDLKAVVDWARSRTGRPQVTLMGMSLGSIPSIAVAVERPEAVNGVILDSPVAMQAQIERFGFLVGGQTAELIQRLDDELLSDTLIARLEQPLLIFSHEDDYLATPETVAVLYDRAVGPKQLVRFPELGHATGQFAKTDAYLYYLDTFLAAVWAPR